MTKMQKALAGGAASLALAMAGAAHATVYELTQDFCTGGCGASPTTPVGTVTTSQDGANTVKIDIELNDPPVLNLAGGDFKGLNSVYFDISGGPDLTFTGLPAPFEVPSNPESAGSNHGDGSGYWDYIVGRTKGNNSGPNPISLVFDVSAPGLTPSSFAANANDLFFAVDVYDTTNGNTGLVGATGPGGFVPEPATWAMMLMGVAGLGGLMRRRRHLALA